MFCEATMYSLYTFPKKQIVQLLNVCTILTGINYLSNLYENANKR